MSARDKIIATFKRLVMETTYDKITVNEICDAAGVSRKTFYVHFQNKAAIVNAIVFKDIVEPMVKMNEVTPSIIGNPEIISQLPKVENRNVYCAIQEDGAFYSRLCSMPGSIDSPLVDALTSAIQSLNLRIMKTIGYEAEAWKLDYISYYYASGNALLIQRWIRSGMAISVDDLTELYDSMTTPFWRQLAGLSA